MTMSEDPTPVAAPTQQDQINAAADTPNNSTAQRLQLLADKGYSWLDAPTQVALASAPSTDTQMVSQASAFQGILSTVASPVHVVAHFFDDPVLQKKPSLALTLQTYLLQRQGWAPIAEADLTGIQQKLADAGYLDKADVNGVWTPQSQDAYLQATSDHVQQQTHEGGGFSITHALSAFLPDHWIPALVGAVKALPGEVRDLAATVSGGVAGLTGDVGYLATLGHVNARQWDNATTAQIESWLGNPENAQQANALRFHHFVSGLNALLTVIPVVRAGKAAAVGFDAVRAAGAQQAVHDAAGTAFYRGLFTDLGPEAAQRGPGVLARSFYSRSPNGAPMGLLGSRLFEQAPVFRQITAPIRAFVDSDGKLSQQGYYALRTKLAQPYRLAGVQAFGSAYQAAMLAGAAERGIAAAETPFDKHTELADQIYSQHTIGGPWGTALDMLSGALHGPLETPFTRAAATQGRHVLIGVNPSVAVGDLVDGVAQNIDTAYRPLNIGWALENGTKLTGHKITVEDLTGKYGQAFTQTFLNTKIEQFAAAHYADLTLDGSGLPHGSQEYMDRFKQLTHEAMGNPELLTQHRNLLLSNMGVLAERFARDATNIRRDARDAYRQGIDQFASVWQPATELFGNHGHELVTPLVRQAITEATGDRQLEAAISGHAAEGAAPGAYSGWLRTNHPGHEPGSLGIARRAAEGQDAETETQTVALGMKKAAQLQAELDAAGSRTFTPEDAAAGVQPLDPAKEAAVRKQAINYLFTFTGLDERELEGRTTQQLIDIIREKAARMPADVSLTLDPSSRASELWRQINDAGYKVVHGTDIGHTFAPPILDPMLIEGYKSKQRLVANAMGLNNLPVSVKTAGSFRHMAVERELQDAINAGRLRVPPSYNGARLNTYLMDRLASRTRLHGAAAAAFRATQRLTMQEARYRAGAGATEQDVTDALHAIEGEIAKNTAPIEVSRNEIVNALTQPLSDILKDAGYSTPDMTFMDEKSARLVADLYARSLIHEPAWIFGAGKLEDLFRAGFGFLGHPASGKVPVLRNIARLPNDMVKFRNRYRFQLDPMFSMRRIAKSALKGSIAGAPFSVRPLAHMIKAGTLEHDLGVLNRVLPMKGSEGFDAMDRLAYDQDAFGLYNPRHHMALLAGELSRQGMSDPQIRREVERAFTYGDRTAMERTLGTVFYPFSFEKTLWRNVGSFMLDRPGARLLTGAALQGYAALAQHEGIDDWLKNHAPLLKEVQKLNAFDHGIGPGQFGGINALYAPAVWNLFGPQKFGAMKEPQLNAVMQMFPALRELNSLLLGENVYTGTHLGYGSLVQQGEIGFWGLQHAVDGASRTVGLGEPFHSVLGILPGRPTTYQAEQTAGYAYRNNLILQLAPVLDFNYHNRNARKVWSDAAILPASIRGKPITRATIDEIVHERYPDFDPSAAQSLAVAKKSEETRYLADLQDSDPQRAAIYQQWYDLASKVIPLMQRAETDPAKYAALAAVTNDFREYAVNLAEQDPQWLSYYNAFYTSRFGPIEAVTP